MAIGRWGCGDLQCLLVNKLQRIGDAGERMKAEGSAGREGIMTKLEFTIGLS